MGCLPCIADDTDDSDASKQIITLMKRDPIVYTKSKWPQDKSFINNKGPLSKEQLEQFATDGVLKVPSVVSKEEIDAAVKDINKLIDDFANKLKKAGKIENTYPDVDWRTRMIKIEKDYQGAIILFVKGGLLPKGIIRYLC
jgi:hypothetical protein